MNLKQVEAINALVNTFPYQSELEDNWSPIDEKDPSGTGGGDCDSYATRKMLDLYKAGMPLADMRLATCTVETGGAHCVLLVEIDGATFVLDNRTDTVKHYDLVPYRWLKIQVAGTPDWVEA
jgi:predicted transglutaminase-like cysteine proteinase